MWSFQVNCLKKLGNANLYQTKEQIKKGAITLYGLLHARYICTENGMQKVYAKYKRGIYGTCPRARCDLQNTIPMGISNVAEQRAVKLFCPRCKEVYDAPKFKKIDSAFFGTTFAQLFMMAYPSIGQIEKTEYVGTIKGFKIHESSLTHPCKIAYNPNQNEYESIPRPKANFNKDEKYLASYTASRRNFLVPKPQLPQ